MISIEEILASAGVSAGAYTVYKVAFRLYSKYYVNSECNHPTPSSTDIIVHISEASRIASFSVGKEEAKEPEPIVEIVI